MDRFDKLYVIADEAAIWKQFDQTVKKQFFKDSALMTFIFFWYIFLHSNGSRSDRVFIYRKSTNLVCGDYGSCDGNVLEHNGVADDTL